MNSVGLATLRYGNGGETGLPGTSPSVASDRVLDATSLVPADALDAPTNVDMLVPWKFSIQRTAKRNWRSFINNTSWESLPRGRFSLDDAQSHSKLQDGSHVLDGCVGSPPVFVPALISCV
jgi:hypothetical protein